MMNVPTALLSQWCAAAARALGGGADGKEKLAADWLNKIRTLNNPNISTARPIETCVVTVHGRSAQPNMKTISVLVIAANQSPDAAGCLEILLYGYGIYFISPRDRDTLEYYLYYSALWAMLLVNVPTWPTLSKQIHEKWRPP